MENKKLQVLDVDNNQISNEGVAAVCEGLQNATALTELWMDNCGLSVEGIYYMLHHHVASYVMWFYDIQCNYGVCGLAESIM